jgi:hypothetical protein
MTMVGERKEKNDKTKDGCYKGDGNGRKGG